MQQEPLLKLTDISKSFYGVKVLEDINFTLYPGEGHCLAGENGSGKSTLIKIISGVYSYDEGGRIEYAGKIIKNMTPIIAHQLGIQVIFQDLALFPNFTVAQNIAINQYVDNGLSLVKPQKAKETAIEVLQRLEVNLPLDARVETLSMADRQIVAIARSLAKSARLLFMDEPTASLTYQEAGTLLRIIAQLKEQGICVVFVSHRLDELMSVADNVTVLRNGKKVAAEPAKELQAKHIAEYMTGKAIMPEPRWRNVQGSKEVLELRNLGKASQFRQISFKLHKGEVLGLIGLLGSGRTELALSLFGMNPPDSGEIFLNGKPYHASNNRQAIEQGLSYLSEDRLNLGVVLDQSIERNLTIASLSELKGRTGLLDTQKIKTFFKRWMDALSVRASSEEADIKTLSGGNQQKIAIAKWLATKPQVLILDSPTVGVDIGARDTIYQIIDDYAQAGFSFLMISDETSEIYYNCDRILHIHKGEIIGEYDPSKISEGDFVKNIEEIKDAIAQ